MLRLGTPAYTVCTHTKACSISHTHTHADCLRKPGFSSSAFLIRHHTLLNERPLVSDSLLFLVISLLSSLSLGGRKKKRITLFPFLSLLFCCFHDNSGREYSPEGLSQWRWLLFGWLYYWGQWSYSSLRLCILDVYMCVRVRVGRWGALRVHVYACMRSCLHAFVHDNAWMNAAGSVCVTESFHERDAVRDEKGKRVPGSFRAFEQCFLNHFN